MRGISRCRPAAAFATARGIAHAYSVFATGGHELELRRDTLDALAAPARPPTRGFFDECLKGEVQFSLGFADPDGGIGYAYPTSRMGTIFTGDPRDVALRNALYSALPSFEGSRCASFKPSSRNIQC
jgi:hypothetical protein